MCVNLPRHLQFVNAGLHLNLQHPLSHFNETKIYLLVSQIHLKKKLSMAKPTNRKKQDELYQQLRECYLLALPKVTLTTVEKYPYYQN